MSDHMTQPLPELAKDIVADGIVDADEVTRLRERLYADGIIDREEADFLFEINDAVSGNQNDPSWQDLFVGALTDHVLADEATPGVVDDDEAEYLVAKINADGQIDEIERALIANIRTKAKSISPKFTL